MQGDLEIQWLRTFQSVVQTGSMTASARHLCRSQSAISMHIKNIEQVLGSEIFSRENKKLLLTPTGHELLHYAESLLAVHHRALSALTGSRQRGQVSLGIPDDYATRYLPPLLRAFARHYPAVEITLSCEPSSLLLPKIATGELDVAITTRGSAEQGTLLTSEPLVWTGNLPVNFSEGEPLPVAMYEFGSEARKKITAVLDTLPAGYRVMYNSPYIAGQIAAAESGVAVAVLTRCSVPPTLAIIHPPLLPALPVLDIAVVRSPVTADNLMAERLVESIISVCRAPRSERF